MTNGQAFSSSVRFAFFPFKEASQNRILRTLQLLLGITYGVMTLTIMFVITPFFLLSGALAIRDIARAILGV